MTEFEKMINNRPYNGLDKILVEKRQKTKEKLFEINQMHPKKKEKRNKLLKNLLNIEDNNFQIESPFFCDYGENITIGKNFYSNFHCTMLDSAKITIKDNVLFGPNVSLYTPNHPYNIADRNNGIEIAKPITIGNNVWVGGSVTIVGGVEIGDNTVIAAGSVVVKDIPSGVLAGGNPCKVIRKLDEKDLKKV